MQDESKFMPSTSSSGDLAYQALIDAIKAGVFVPGDRLREEDVAERLSLSRTPVREAIRRLEAEGLVDHQPRIGATIKKLTHQEIVEIYEMRLVLEEAAAGMAARHVSEAEIAIMRDLNAQLAQTEDKAEAAEINADLHRAIYLAGRNPYLLRYFEELSNVLVLLGPTTISSEARIEEVVSQHEKLIDAIDAKDEVAAKTLARAHLTTSLSARLRSIT